MKTVFSLIFFLSSFAYAQTRQILVDNSNIAPAVVTICSQNLKNYQAQSYSKSSRTDQEIDLIKRFIQAKCDIIAVQEVIGLDEIKAKNNISRLAFLLEISSKRKFETKVGDVNDANQRVGFLIATDKAEITNSITYRKLLLPKLDEAQKPRLFIRAPLEVQLNLKSYNESPEKQLSIVNFHFKSKSKGQDDPAMLQWETYRIEMAEGLRRIVLSRYKKNMLSGNPVILIGDRNSHYDSASAKILEGALTIDHFRGDAVCRLNKRGAPLCQHNVQKEKDFVSVITEDPETKKLPGTYKYKKVYSFIDDILVNTQSLGFFREKPSLEGNYDSGIVYDHPNASDHALIYVRFRW